MSVLVLTATSIILLAAVPPEGRRPAPMEVVLSIGNGKVAEDPKVSPVVLAVDASGQFRSGADLLGRIDLGELVADSLKDKDFVRYRIDLDAPDTTSAILILKLIDQVQRSVKGGKRVELTFSYRPEPKKG